MNVLRGRSGGFTPVKKPWPLWWKLFLGLCALGGVGFGVSQAFSWAVESIPAGPAEVNVLELWNRGSYSELIEYGRYELEQDPLRAPSLIFNGFSYFQQAMAQTDQESRGPLLEQAVAHLRKVLLLPPQSLLPQVHYVLGKAYYHKGKYFSDAAIRHLMRARELGFEAEDIFEYLGLSYSQLGLHEGARTWFQQALARQRSDLLLWTLGQTEYQLGQTAAALSYLNEVLTLTEDRALILRTRFLLADIYRQSEQWGEAEAQYMSILELNQNSADAYFFLGEIFLAQGNREKARAQWVRAFRIDPLHYNANQRLFQR